MLIISQTHLKFKFIYMVLSDTTYEIHVSTKFNI